MTLPQTSDSNQLLPVISPHSNSDELASLRADLRQLEEAWRNSYLILQTRTSAENAHLRDKNVDQEIAHRETAERVAVGAFWMGLGFGVAISALTAMLIMLIT